MRSVEEGGLRFVEGPPGEPLLRTDRDVSLVIEACFGDRVGAALLHAENLPAAFFDLSSRQAGEILQKLRNYHIRLAVVCPPGGVQQSSRFGEMLAEEQNGRDFGVFATRESALAWLRLGEDEEAEPGAD